tara:strand:+ start:7371 stop:7967 length:597 start_codon:yes stop_codon:yes gene_type:complete
MNKKNSSNNVLPKTHKQDLLMSSLQEFYKESDNIKIILDILNGKSKISLRIIDWYVTNFSKKKNTNYEIFITKNNLKTKKQFNVYIDYKLQLKGYSKKQFDPFCRRERINFYYDNENFIVTTVGQLNFFRWAISNDIIKNIEKNLNLIELDMNNSYRAIYKLSNKQSPITIRRKRHELSLSATRCITKHNVKITVAFD